MNTLALYCPCTNNYHLLDLLDIYSRQTSEYKAMFLLETELFRPIEWMGRKIEIPDDLQKILHNLYNDVTKVLGVRFYFDSNTIVGCAMIQLDGDYKEVIHQTQSRINESLE